MVTEPPPADIEDSSEDDYEEDYDDDLTTPSSDISTEESEEKSEPVKGKGKGNKEPKPKPKDSTPSPSVVKSTASIRAKRAAAKVSPSPTASVRSIFTWCCFCSHVVSLLTWRPASSFGDSRNHCKLEFCCFPDRHFRGKPPWPGVTLDKLPVKRKSREWCCVISSLWWAVSVNQSLYYQRPSHWG